MDETARQAWRLRTLHALRGHFRESKPDDPADLTQGQSDAHTIIIHCIDSRLRETEDLNLARGEAFIDTSAGAGVPPFDQGGASLQTEVSLGFPVGNYQSVRNIIVMGHTHCGANAALHGTLTGQGDPHNTEAKWMQPLTDERLAEALTEGKKQGISDEQQQRTVEQLTVLQSMRNLYGYHYHDKSAIDYVNDEGLNIIGAIRDIQKDKDGKLPLLVFDPHAQEFRRIEEIYDEAFPGNNRRSSEMIEATYAKSGQKQQDPLSSSPVAFQKGSKSTTLAEISIKEIDSGIQKLLEKARGADRMSR